MVSKKFKPEEISELKKKHGVEKLFIVKADDKECLLKQPSRKALSYATAAAGPNKDHIKFNEALLKECFVAGDEDFKSNDSYFYAISVKLAELIEVKEAEMGEL